MAAIKGAMDEIFDRKSTRRGPADQKDRQC
jgi:hypothetical protein